MSTPLLLRFVSEARDLLQMAASGLLSLEKSPGDEAVLNEVFRAVHTIKGSVGLFDYPAFLRLTHAGEDVLSAVRAGEIGLDPALVDTLLDALDRIGAWVDAIEATGNLPADADGTSRDLSEVLRANLPQGAVETPTAEATGAAEGSLEWLGQIPEADRRAALALALGEPGVLALEYLPVEDCFYSGEDPLGLLRPLPVLALLVESRAPWPSVEVLDPYACVLRFRALIAAPRLEMEAHFRYVIEQITLTPVPAQALAVGTGTPVDGPVFEDFAAQAHPWIACGDWASLRTAVRGLQELTGPTTLAASGLRWLETVLALPDPPASWVLALVDGIAHGSLAALPALPCQPTPSLCATSSDLPPAGEPPPVPAAPGSPSPALPLSRHARRLLESQRTLLEGRDLGSFQSRLAAAARTVSNVLRATGQETREWEAAVAQARQVAQAAPALAALARLTATPSAPLSSDSAAPAGKARPPAPADESVRARRPAPPSRSSPPEIPAMGEGRGGAPRVLKVEQGRIDGLMNLIGELVVSKNSLPFLARRAENVYGSREMSREIKDLYAVVDRLAQEMQTAIMAVRMLPVSEVFDRFPRLVRDVARRLGKQVELVIEGEDTAADKNIIEVLNDPLLHIVRNALDHGIELPAERVAAGKEQTARLLVRAFQESDQVVIEVSDDGRGIDPERIRASAVAKGAVSAERAAHLNDQEAVNLVFLPGFSTAEEVSDLSGRGVGMDVVATTVEKAAGTVSLTSTKGTGTTVRLSLPLSMAVTRVMMVEAGGGQLFGIPMDHIAETVRIPRRSIRRIKQSEAFVLREAIVPLLRLDSLLALVPPGMAPSDGGEADPEAEPEAEEDAVLVVRLGGTLTGLVVDHFREGMDIILKPFDGILTGIRGYAGTALLGDGRVLLILNLKELL